MIDIVHSAKSGSGGGGGSGGGTGGVRGRGVEGGRGPRGPNGERRGDSSNGKVRRVPPALVQRFSGLAARPIALLFRPKAKKNNERDRLVNYGIAGGTEPLSHQLIVNFQPVICKGAADTVPVI